MWRLLILPAILALVGCGTEFKAEVESDTSWSGAFDDRTVDGTGNKTVKLGDDSPQCCVVQKQTEEGTLSVRIVADGGGFFGMFGPSDSKWVTTTAAYGVVTVCDGD